MSGMSSLLISKKYGHDRYVNHEKYPVEINRTKKPFWIKAKFFRRGDKKAKKTLRSMKLMITSWKLQGSRLIFLIFYDWNPAGLIDTYLATFNISWYYFWRQNIISSLSAFLVLLNLWYGCTNIVFAFILLVALHCHEEKQNKKKLSAILIITKPTAHGVRVHKKLWMWVKFRLASFCLEAFFCKANSIGQKHITSYSDSYF